MTSTSVSPLYRQDVMLWVLRHLAGSSADLIAAAEKIAAAGVSPHLLRLEPSMDGGIGQIDERIADAQQFSAWINASSREVAIDPAP